MSLRQLCVLLIALASLFISVAGQERRADDDAPAEDTEAGGAVAEDGPDEGEVGLLQKVSGILSSVFGGEEDRGRDAASLRQNGCVLNGHIYPHGKFIIIIYRNAYCILKCDNGKWLARCYPLYPAKKTEPVKEAEVGGLAADSPDHSPETQGQRSLLRSSLRQDGTNNDCTNPAGTHEAIENINEGPVPVDTPDKGEEAGVRYEFSEIISDLEEIEKDEHHRKRMNKNQGNKMNKNGNSN